MIEKIYASPIRQLYDIQVGNTKEQNSATESFGSFLKDALGKLNSSQLEADGAITSFLRGESIDVHSVMVSIQKAELTLNLAMQLRNKVIDAYQEIMRMQV